MTLLVSPTHVIWEYFSSLQQLVAAANEARNRELRRQAAALAVIMGVTVGEVFLNVWFRVRVEEIHDKAERNAFLKDLSPPFKSLERKLQDWPKQYLGKELDLQSGPGRAFTDLKDLRNSIVHFKSTHETITYDNVSIHGLADFTSYDSLNYESARAAFETIQAFVAEIFRLAGVSPKEIPHELRTWTGIVN